MMDTSLKERNARVMMRRPLSFTSATYRRLDPYVLMPTRRWRRPSAGRIAPSGVVENATPGRMVRSIHPFSIAGSELHHVGYTNTIASAAATRRPCSATRWSSASSAAAVALGLSDAM